MEGDVVKTDVMEAGKVEECNGVLTDNGEARSLVNVVAKFMFQFTN